MRREWEAKLEAIEKEREGGWKEGRKETAFRDGWRELEILYSQNRQGREWKHDLEAGKREKGKESFQASHTPLMHN
jgi:hypothetical protein